MFKTTQDFLNEWEKEAKLTTNVLKAITPEALNTSPNDANWSLGRISYHLTETFGSFLPQLLGVTTEPKASREEAIKDNQLLVDIYKAGSKEFAANVKNNILDTNLNEKINFFGTEMTKADALYGLIKHQIHHRGQLTTLLRQAGVIAPGVYGPNKETWEAMGLPARD